jgi:hypothetical protein
MSIPSGQSRACTPEPRGLLSLEAATLIVQDAASEAQQALSGLSLDGGRKADLLSRVNDLARDYATEITNQPTGAKRINFVRKAQDSIWTQVALGLGTYVHELQTRCLNIQTRGGTPAVSALAPIKDKLTALAETLESDRRPNRQRPDALCAAASELAILDAALTSLDDVLRSETRWGNPRHHLVGAIIGVATMLVSIPLTLIAEHGSSDGGASRPSLRVGDSREHVDASATTQVAPHPPSAARAREKQVPGSRVALDTDTTRHGLSRRTGISAAHPTGGKVPIVPPVAIPYPAPLSSNGRHGLNGVSATQTTVVIPRSAIPPRLDGRGSPRTCQRK